MASEITCALSERAGTGPPRILALGGPGWLQDAATAIGEIEEGWEYYVQIGTARIAVIVAEHEGRRYLRTDPEQTADNELLSLPACG